MLKFIYRRDISKQNHGWNVVIEIDPSVRCYFSDREYGGKAESLIAAVKFRNETLTKYNIPFIENRRISLKPRSTNLTGVTGVCLSGDYYHGYFPVEENIILRRKFSLNTHGEPQAFRKTVEWRLRLETAVYGFTIVPQKVRSSLGLSS